MPTLSLLSLLLQTAGEEEFPYRELLQKEVEPEDILKLLKLTDRAIEAQLPYNKHQIRRFGCSTSVNQWMPLGLHGERLVIINRGDVNWSLGWVNDFTKYRKKKPPLDYITHDDIPDITGGVYPLIEGEAFEEVLIKSPGGGSGDLVLLAEWRDI